MFFLTLIHREMRKGMLFFVFVVLFSLAQYACQKDAIVFQTPNVESSLKTTTCDIDSALLADLSSFNARFAKVIENRQSLPPVRGFWSGFSKVLKVCAADIVGIGAGINAGKGIAAAAGLATGGAGAVAVLVSCGAIVGASASIGAAETFGYHGNVQCFVSNFSLGSSPEFSQYVMLGKEHNLWVEKLKNNRDESLNELSEDIKGILRNPIFISKEELIKNILNKHRNDKDKEPMIKELIDNGLISGRIGSIYDLFFGIYDKAENLDDVEVIAKEYFMRIIKDSSFNSDEKEILIASFSVSYESPYLWMRQNPLKADDLH